MAKDPSNTGSKNERLGAKSTEDLIRICSYCKKIADDRDLWHSIEAFLQRYYGLRFTHTICPECVQKVCKEESINLNSEQP